MLSSSQPKIHEPPVIGVSPRPRDLPRDQRQRQKTAKHEWTARDRVSECKAPFPTGSAVPGIDSLDHAEVVADRPVLG
jgi:hypothetical protein